MESATRTIRVLFGDKVVARSDRGYRLLETSHPPVYYVPPEDVALDMLVPSRRMGSTACEFKGAAEYLGLAPELARSVGDRAVTDPVAWRYPEVAKGFEAMRGYIGFYARALDCYLDDEKVTPQEGEFYGGWITRELVGPFKGGPGTWGW